ncbi:membrane protein [Synergistales bacterium]|nr:membrane protein [Synergistales bacterium]
MRPYAEGDSMKRIHWKSSARTGTLKTRIYEGTARRDRQVSAPYRPPDASADARFAGPGFSLKNLLNILSVVCALLAFFMGKEVIGRPYLFAFPVIIAIAVFIDWKDLPHPPRLFINLASVAALLTIFSHIRFNYIIEALLEAVLLMTAIKMLEKKEPRDYVQISALSLAAIVAYAMLSVEKTFILYCFGTTFFCIVSLTLSAWFLREPDARLAMRELRHVFLRAASLFLLTLPLSLLLFFVMPRMDRPIFGSARGQYGSRTDAVGFSDQVRLGDATSIQGNNKLAFRALTEQLPNNVIPYWRGLVLDAFEGRVWLAGRGRQDGGEFVLEPGAPVIEQEIFLEPGNRGVLFTLDQPLSVSGIDAVGLGDGVFRAQPRFTGRRMQYSAVSVLSSQMRPQSPNFDKGRNLLLPPLFIPRLREAAADIARGKNAREKAEAIKAYLAPPAFTYSLDGLPDDPRNALEQFIFTTKRGNCEYFASAMGVMLRAAGVPSRLVSGYAGGTYSDVGGYYIVQEDNAHVWVEAWDEDARAWIRYDPTPIEIGAGAADGFDAWGFYLDMIDYQWSRFIVGYNWEAQSEMLRGLRDAIQNPRAAGLTPTVEGLRRFSSALSGSAAALTGVALCVVGFYLLRTVRRPEIALLRRFLTAMKRHGYTRHESEGLEEFLSRVDEPLRVLALPFVRRFEDFYYGGAAINAAARHISREEIKKIARYKN